MPDISQILPKIKTANQSPIYEFMENDQTFPAGMWRWKVQGDIAVLERATAVDWTTDEDWIAFDKGNNRIVILKDFLPVSDNALDIGSALLSFANIHVETIVYATTVHGNWSPDATGTYTLGTSTYGWLGIFVDASAGADDDIDIITANVTGTPKLWWDESMDGFNFDRNLSLGLWGDTNGIALSDALSSAFYVFGDLPSTGSALSAAELVRGGWVRAEVNKAQTNECSILGLEGQIRVKQNLGDGTHAGVWAYFEHSGTVTLSSPGTNQALLATVEAHTGLTLDSGATLAALTVDSSVDATLSLSGNFYGIWIKTATTAGQPVSQDFETMIFIDPIADADVNILKLDVTGTPTLFWDESEDMFVFTHGVQVGTWGSHVVATTTENFALSVMNELSTDIADGTGETTIRGAWLRHKMTAKRQDRGISTGAEIQLRIQAGGDTIGPSSAGGYGAIYPALWAYTEVMGVTGTALNMINATLCAIEACVNCELPTTDASSHVLGISVRNMVSNKTALNAASSFAGIKISKLAGYVNWNTGLEIDDGTCDIDIELQYGATILGDSAGDMTLNALSGKSVHIAVNGTDEYNFSATTADFNTNTVTNVGTITVTNAAGPAFVNEAATNTNPTLVPNRDEMDTGIGWTSTDIINIILGSANEYAFSTTALNMYGNNLTAVGTLATTGTITCGSHLSVPQGSYIYLDGQGGSEHIYSQTAGKLTITASSASIDAITLAGKVLITDVLYLSDVVTFTTHAHFGDTDRLYFGDSDEFYFYCTTDGATMYLRPSATGKYFEFGESAVGIDVSLWTDTGGDRIEFDASAKTLYFRDVHIQLETMARLDIGSNADFGLYFTGGVDLYLDPAATGKTFNFGQSGEGLSVYLWSDTGGDYVHWNAATKILSFVDATLVVGVTGGGAGCDATFYGNTNGNYMQWDASADDLLLVGTATQLGIAGTTDAADTSTGSIHTAGGVGIAKKLYTGETTSLCGGQLVVETWGVVMSGDSFYVAADYAAYITSLAAGELDLAASTRVNIRTGAAGVAMMFDAGMVQTNRPFWSISGGILLSETSFLRLAMRTGVPGGEASVWYDPDIDKILFKTAAGTSTILDSTGGTLADAAIINLKAGTAVINPESAHRGQFYFIEAAGGSADKLYCIMKGADDAYTAVQVAIG